MPASIVTQGRVTWINIVKPDQADMAELAERYPNFHPLNLQDSLGGIEFPKLDHHDDYLFLVVHKPHFDEAERLYEREEIDIFVAKGTLVTTSSGKVEVLNEMFKSAQQSEAARETLMGRGASPLLYELLSRVIEGVLPMMTRYDHDIHHLETSLFKTDTRHILNEIAVARRDLIALRHILRPQLPVIRALADGNWPWIHEDLDLYWKDIGDTLAQLQSRLDENIELVSGLSETIDTLASHRIDEVVRVLTIITVLTLPLTLLSTIFSMNVVLPFEDHPASFFVVIALGVAFTIGLVWYLRTRRWL